MTVQDRWYWEDNVKEHYEGDEFEDSEEED